MDTPSAIDEPAVEPIAIVDALGREVTLPAAPQRIVLTGRALFMIADAVYLFPGAGQRIVAIGSKAQGGGNFVELIDPNYADKAVLCDDLARTLLPGQGFTAAQAALAGGRYRVGIAVVRPALVETFSVLLPPERVVAPDSSNSSEKQAASLWETIGAVSAP